jgi:hypothetical protein
MQRRLTATIGLLVVLALAGCGKDEPSGASASANATTTTVASGAASAGNGVGAQSGAAKQSGSKKRSGSKTPDSKKGSDPKNGSGSKKGSKASDSASATSKTSSTSKKSSGSKPAAAKKPGASGDAASPADASAGGDSPDARLAVVAVVRRYQKDFIDGDGDDACSLLTAAGKKQMTSGGRGRTCAESVKRVLDQSRASDIRLIERTRAGIHVDDVAIRGDNATVDIGKGQQLRLARQDGGRWLVSDPSP